MALGVAVGTAVLAGALLVGDSVRGSLRNLTLERLGAIDHALVSDRYFREDLARDLTAAAGPEEYSLETVPAILIRGSVEAAAGGARASRVNIYGVNDRFWRLFEPPETKPGGREILLNEKLAREIGVSAGDAVLLRFQADTLIPAESVMGSREGNVRTLRLNAAGVVPGRGLGRFGLSPSQQLPLNVFLPLEQAQRALDQPGRVNALFVSGGRSRESAGWLNNLLDQKLTLSDLRLKLRPLEDRGVFALESGRVMLDEVTAEQAAQAAEEADLAYEPILTYVANAIRLGEREIPYSTVTAVGDAQSQVLGRLSLTNGRPAPDPRAREVLLNQWAALDLRASPGDAIELDYYAVGPQGQLETKTHRFQLTGVVRMRGLAADQDLAPEVKGMTGVERMSDWDPPFPIDLGRIRPKDEDYWTTYRTAPKAFVDLETGKKLWASRFGQLTSIRFAPPADRNLRDAVADFSQLLTKRLHPAAYGLGFQPVKAQGLEASSGATDFSGLFTGFSLFLIVSAAMLVGLLFRLGVERRAREVGLLLAAGQPPALVRSLLLREGLIIAAAGCLVGLPAAVGYGALMVYGLRTWWSAAVGGSFLELHVTAPSLIGGAIGAFLMMILSIRFSVRELERLTPRSLLAGQVRAAEAAPGEDRARRTRQAGWASFALALLFTGLSFLGAVEMVTGFFAVGTLLLIALLAYFRAQLLAASGGAIHPERPFALARLGARNGARHPTRSVLSAALVACATFVIVTVAVSRQDVTAQTPEYESGNGGFRWIAESAAPLYGDQLKFGGEELPPMDLYPMRRQLGEDASCLNLYQPGRPTLLGAPAEFIERGGFVFADTMAGTRREESNPWRLLNKKREDGAIPVIGDANSVRWILHLGLGDTLEITDEQGRSRRLMIVATLSRSIFQSELILSEKHFLELFPSHSGYHTFVIETPSEEAGPLLEQRLGEFGFDAVKTTERLAGFLVVENTYLSTFQTLGGLGLLLGTLGLAIVMIRSVIERRRELALLQAVGFVQRSISWLVLAENAFLLVFGILAGTVTALLATAPHLMSAVAEPPWGSLLLTLLAVLAVGLLAGAAAVAASLRTPLTPALKRE